ncbi:hypothetical protein G2W53_039217 [Senna tora]|uniref:Uncharacterized protein n=1 Tax=Senna tora TaxID=362788 RepID=A0A834SPL5_9FABA|nr:hypothetical protein G2W53_039217 [Senna tora]
MLGNKPLINKPSRRISTQHFSQQILSRRRHRVKNSAWKPQVSSKHGLENLHRRIPIKRRERSQHYIQNDTGTPHVHLLVVLPAGENFRRHVIRRAHHAAHPLALLEGLRRAEVRQLEPAALRVEQYVIRLDIAVRHAAPVAVSHGSHELRHDLRGFGLGYGRGRRPERYVVDVHDVRVRREEAEDFGLGEEALRVEGVAGGGDERFVDGFHSEGDAGVGGDAPEDGAESSPSDLRQNDVVLIEVFTHYSACVV